MALVVPVLAGAAVGRRCAAAAADREGRLRAVAGSVGVWTFLPGAVMVWLSGAADRAERCPRGGPSYRAEDRSE